jgi:hypothetical protein
MSSDQWTIADPQTADFDGDLAELARATWSIARDVPPPSY